MWGDVFPRCGDLGGENYPLVDRVASRPTVTCKSKILGEFVVSIRPSTRIEHYSTNGVWQLDQPQLDCPLNSRPAAIDVELAVDTLGVGTDRTQADHQLAGNLRSGQLGLE